MSKQSVVSGVALLGLLNWGEEFAADCTIRQRVTANRADVNMHVPGGIVARSSSVPTQTKRRVAIPARAACTRLMRKRSSTAELSIVVVRSSTEKCRP